MRSHFVLVFALFAVVHAESTYTITAPPSLPTAALAPVKRQDTAEINSAQSFYSACVNSCTDVVQSAVVSSRLAIDSSDAFCDDFGDRPGSSNCFCGNFIEDPTNIGSSVSSCASASCTGVPSDIQTFLDFPDGFLTTYIADLNSVICDQRQFPAQSFTGSVQPTNGATSASASASGASSSAASSSASAGSSAGTGASVSITASSSSSSGSASSTGGANASSTSNAASPRTAFGVPKTQFSNAIELAVLAVLAMPLFVAFARLL